MEFFFFFLAGAMAPPSHYVTPPLNRVQKSVGIRSKDIILHRNKSKQNLKQDGKHRHPTTIRLTMMEQSQMQTTLLGLVWLFETAMGK